MVKADTPWGDAPGSPNPTATQDELRAYARRIQDRFAEQAPILDERQKNRLA